MGKRIVLCFDGTWNTPAEKFVGLRALHERFARIVKGGSDAIRQALEAIDPGPDAVETNVCRFYRSVRRLDAAEAGPDGKAQVKWYDAGVGTRWFERIRGGAFGMGLDCNIREGYRFLAETWEPDDEVFILGFSRGAYTARSLVGMIRKCGLLPAGATGRSPDSAEMLEAYELYRARDEGADSERARAYRAERRPRDIRIRFLGVWDTVGALGLPVQSFESFNRRMFEFHDTELSSIVEHAYHAIAVDEHRGPYAATLWDPRHKPHQVMEQRWFVGAHCDVGGGYQDRTLSDVTLAWMQEKAQACGLLLDPVGIPAVAPQNALGAMADSFTAFLSGAFRLFNSRHYRPVRSTLHGQEAVDATVLARLAGGIGYRPQNRGLRDLG